MECTAKGGGGAQAHLSLKDKYGIDNFAANASGNHQRDIYLLNLNSFDQGYFIIPFDLTAVQDGGESSTPLPRILVNIRLTFTSRNATLQALFFYNMNKSLIQVDNRGMVQRPIPLEDIRRQLKDIELQRWLSEINIDTRKDANQGNKMIDNYNCEDYLHQVTNT